MREVLAQVFTGCVQGQHTAPPQREKCLVQQVVKRAGLDFIVLGKHALALTSQAGPSAHGTQRGVRRFNLFWCCQRALHAREHARVRKRQVLDLGLEVQFYGVTLADKWFQFKILIHVQRI